MAAAMTAKDIFLLKELSDIQISADGSRIAWLQTETNRQKNRKESAIWLATSGEGSPAAALTGDRSDSKPRFSPDGRKIAFCSERDRENPGGLYLISLQGGEAHLLQGEHSLASAPLWSPDGSKIAFLSFVKQEAAARYRGETKELYQPPEEEMLRAPQVINAISYRQDGRGFTLGGHNQLFVFDLEDNACVQLTQEQHTIGAFIWNHNATALCYAVTYIDETSFRFQSRVLQVTAANQALQHLLDFAGSINSLSLPDPQTLLLSGVDQTYPNGIGLSLLWQADLSAAGPLAPQELKCLNPHSPAGCEKPIFTAATQNLTYLRLWQGCKSLCRSAAASGFGTEEPAALTLATVTDFSCDQAGRLAFIATDFTHPPEVYYADGKTTRRISGVHDQLLAKFPALPAEKFTVQNEGLPIEAWLLKPPGAQAGVALPTILNIHGGPTGVYLDAYQISFQLQAYQGYAVLFANPRGSSSYGPAFSAAGCSDWGGADYRDLMAAVDFSIALGIADPKRLGVTGWSYGGYMTAWIVTQNQRFKAAVAGAMISNWLTLSCVCDINIYDEGLWEQPLFLDYGKAMQRSPVTQVAAVTTPILLLHGGADMRCPIEQSEQFYFALKRMGKETVYVYYPGQSHAFGLPAYIEDRWQRTLNWMRERL
ncbi:MAG: S9 family peptidase [Negativicutes bacterium]|nr:S9 family peptidase [Negativicutes bacterium]